MVKVASWPRMRSNRGLVWPRCLPVSWFRVSAFLIDWACPHAVEESLVTKPFTWKKWVVENYPLPPPPHPHTHWGMDKLWAKYFVFLENWTFWCPVLGSRNCTRTWHPSTVVLARYCARGQLHSIWEKNRWPHPFTQGWEFNQWFFDRINLFLWSKDWFDL